MKIEGKPKFKKHGGESAQPGELVTPPRSSEETAPPPSGDQSPAPGNGNERKHKKDDGKPPQEACPEGTVPIGDGSCATPQ